VQEERRLRHEAEASAAAALQRADELEMQLKAQKAALKRQTKTQKAALKKQLGAQIAALKKQLAAQAAAHDDEVNELYEQLLAEKQQVLNYCDQEQNFMPGC
jgi:hypothetical protein